MKSLGIGQKLIIFFSIGLFLLLFAMFSSNYILRNIDQSKNSLTNASIPALVGVNAMSLYAHDLIEFSLKMSDSKTIYELNSNKDNSFESIYYLYTELKQLNDVSTLNKSSDEIETILGKLENNLNIEYEILNKSLKTKGEFSHELKIMRSALEGIAQSTTLIKINVKDKFTEQITELRENKNFENLALNSITNIGVISELIARTAELRKNMLTIEGADSKDKILDIEQEYDHALRVITRSVVNYKGLDLRKDMGPHILTLIKYGQDTPDLFDARLKLTETSRQVSALHKENSALTKQLYEAVNLLSISVKDNTDKTALALSKTILNSQYAFYVVAIISIIFFLLVVWKFVYQDIIIRLAKLSIVTKKLSSDNLNFEIDESGQDEFSKFASTLNMLRSLMRMRKTLNEELKKKTTLLERSNEDLSLFAYIASHDLQEPLRVISSYSQLLSKRYAGNLDEDADKFINYVVTGCSRMEALVEGLLTFSRVDTQEGDEKSIWIEEILKDIKQDLRIKINESFALITWSEMPNIYADPVQIRTVLLNIISNAIKYNQSKPPKIHINAEQVGDFWKFYVEDNGIGIDEKYYEKVFVIFKRLHSRDKYTGTGIGLSVCKKIIERYGGEISLKSNPDEGTIFIFTLPIDDRYRLDKTNQIAA